ncbi:hypothetical protein sos41_01580 [Alphaproteobacteria bacterium SO-S41]|nr:hypothetical protein sos41_01580 [Alphaproteobacteria bacterium SO-S41]
MSDAVYFDATLRPSRSLDRRGFVLLLSLLTALNLVVALRLAASGGWPILPFLGLDIAGLAFAFALNYRSGRLAEHIRLSGDALTVTHVDPGGAAKDWAFEPAWVRVALHERPHGAGRVTITTNGKGVAVAEFLTQGERQDIAAALNKALSERARRLTAA